ncbi:Hypothetical protein NTJ_08217 [Nesidiocoris tenuis]|uniref:Secreted protein n=1 Tax=Nesidiocoris tenuis TaxID=355587 RepID=A0ABN7AT79_9HEMI|nr:Hypothetical protein NTJ_08217 [Nesidiocoris tenuis]
MRPKAREETLISFLSYCAGSAGFRTGAPPPPTRRPRIGDRRRRECPHCACADHPRDANGNFERRFCFSATTRIRRINY